MGTTRTALIALAAIPFLAPPVVWAAEAVTTESEYIQLAAAELEPGPEAVEAPEAEEAASADEASLLTYVPPSRGAPDGRWGAGTRGDGVPPIGVLAPEHAGLTALEQPTLYWHLGAASELEVTLIVIDPRTDEAVLDVRVPPPVAAGIHELDLREHDVKLEAGVDYQWMAALLPSPDRRYYGVTAGGVIALSSDAAAVQTQLAGMDVAAQARTLAGAGIWYDAYAVLGDGAPESQALRTTLLRQVGLNHIAP